MNDLSLNFSESTRSNVILTFDNITRRYYLTENSELESKLITGVQVFYRSIISETITQDAIAYTTILKVNMADYRLTLYEQGKENPIIENLPLNSLTVQGNARTGSPANIPGGFILPLGLKIDTRRSYIDSNDITFQPYFIPLQFYTRKK